MHRAARCARHGLVLWAAWSLGCGRGTREIAPAEGDVCALTSGFSKPDTIVIGLAGLVDPAHAPVPQSQAERLLFRHLYHTLIEVDCRGEVTPGLAESWVAEQDARIWTFTLRSDAAYWDGTPVTAASIRDSWLMHASHRVAPWADSVAGSVGVTSRHELRVRMRRPYDAVPRVFADPTLAVAHPVETPGTWLPGTGTYHVTAHAVGETLLEPLGAVSSDELPALRFLDVGDDPRDAIDWGVDLLVSREPIVVDYVSNLEGLRAHPLPWDLVYVLATPLRLAADVESDEGWTLAGALDPSTVDTESREPEASGWWDSFDACRLVSAFSVPPDLGDIAGRILYHSSDSVARALAERLVALAELGALPQVTDASERLTAVGAGSEPFSAALADGRDLGFVLAVPKLVLDRCAMVALLREAMPWVAVSDLERVLVPLVETRSRLIVSKDVGTVVIDWSGVPSLSVAVDH
jgi:hypothetical protein